MSEIKLERLPLRKNICWSFAGNIIYNGSLWLMLMAMTKFMPVEDVGQFVLASAIVAPILYFTNLQLRPIQGSDSKNEYCFGEYFALRLITVSLAIVTSIAVALFLYKGTQMIMVVGAVVLYRAMDSCSDITYGLMQKQERLDRVAKSRIIKGLLGAFIFIITLLLTDSMNLSFISVAGVWLINFIRFDLGSVRKYESVIPRFHRKRLKKLTVLAIPLGLTMACVSLNSAIPRYFTEKYLGSAQLGYFGALAYFIAALQTVMVAVGPSALPRMADYYANNKPAYMKLLSKMCTLAAVIGLTGVIGGIFLGKPFLALVYTEKYAEHSSLFIWLLIAGGIGYITSMLCVGLTAARFFKIQVPLSALTASVLVIGSIVLIPRYESKGAAWAMLAGNLSQGLGALLIILWNIHFHTPKPQEKHPLNKII